MNTQDENQDTVYTSAYNPFPEPQTIPAGWDLSELLAAPVSEQPSDDSIKNTSEQCKQVHK